MIWQWKNGYKLEYETFEVCVRFFELLDGDTLKASFSCQAKLLV